MDGPSWRIAELAERTGTSVRNIRYYGQIGVLPRPTVRGRTGWYGPRHADRLTLIRRLRARGYSLSTIADMVDGQVPAILYGDVERDPATAAWDASTPDRLTLAQVRDLVPRLADEPALLDDIVRSGQLVPDAGWRGPADPDPDPDHGFAVPQPPLLRAGFALISRGVPVEVALEELGQLRAEMAIIAGRFSRIVHRDMLTEPTMPGETVAAVVEKIWPAVLVAVGRVLTDEMRAAVDHPDLDS